MKLSQLSLADYNKLDSIPVINQDLSASGFTPVANTYYRHTGATTDTFTQGVIYLYDTAYHKLGESGGGTTLNKYYVSNTYNNSKLLHKICQNAKGKVLILSNKGTVLTPVTWAFDGAMSLRLQATVFANNNRIIILDAELPKGSTAYSYVRETIISGFADGTTGESLSGFTYDNAARPAFAVTYYNDTEIT